VTSADSDLIVYTGVSLESPKARKLQKAGVELLQANVRKDQIDLGPLLRDLGRRDILSVLLESGPMLNAGALAQNVVDKLVLFYAPKIAGETRVPFVGSLPSGSPAMHISSVRQFGPDVALELLPKKARR
jgi:diaminohydroxyphosphoribosylaminopyrimidine deaminase/5-amino-6-(5-phosphoribosylamino)uracil reductase